MLSSEESPTHADLANRLRARRTALELSQEEAAVRAGLSTATWERVEEGEVPTLGHLGAMAHALGLPLEGLFLGKATDDQLLSTTQLKQQMVSDGEANELAGLHHRLAYLMELDEHLRYIQVGAHFDKPSPIPSIKIPTAQEG